MLRKMALICTGMSVREKVLKTSLFHCSLMPPPLGNCMLRAHLPAGLLSLVPPPLGADLAPAQ